MTYLTKLAIPLGLALAAAAVNWLVLNSRTKPIALTCVTESINVGDRIDAEMLAQVDVPASFVSLIEVAVPYSDRGVLLQQRANCRYRKGDLVLWRDINTKGPPLDLRMGEDAIIISLDGVAPETELLKIGNKVSLRVAAVADATQPRPTGGVETAEWIGPFRIVTIGAAVVNDAEEKRRGSASTIGIAVKQVRDAEEEKQVRRLESFCDRQRQHGARLLGVKLHRAED